MIIIYLLFNYKKSYIYINMEEFNRQLLDEIDFVRTNPKRYARKIEKYIEKFKDNTLIIPELNLSIPTEEGPEAFKEAISFLVNEQRRSALNPSRGLCRAAEDLLYEAQRDADNVGSIRVEKLINKYGTIKGSLSRLIDLGGETPELVVINLIVSDGDPSRGQRNSLLNAEVKKIGVANAKDENYGHCSVIIMLTEFINKVDENDYGILVGEVIDHSERDRDRLKDDEEEVEEGVVSIDKTETIVEENGKMKKITKIVKNLEDGRKKIETIKQDID